MCHMHKKGQIIYFILFGFIMLIAGSLIIQVYNQNRLKESEIEKSLKLPEIESIKKFIDACLKLTGNDGLFLLGKQGGYFYLPKLYDREYYTPYYFYLDRNVMPFLSVIEQELGRYIDEMLPKCLDDFKEFKKMGYRFDYNQINVTTKIRINDVLLNVKFPINIYHSQSEYNLQDFQTLIDKIKLLNIYQISRLITEGSVRNPQKICFSCAINFSIQNNLTIEFYKIRNDSLLIIITDKDYNIYNKSYEFIFANKYQSFSCSNLPPDDIEYILNCVEEKIKFFNYNFEIIRIPNLIARTDVEFYYDVNATGLNVTFMDFTELFDINNKTGEIRTNFDQSKSGNYTIWISAQDLFKNKKYEVFKLEVI